MYVFSKYVIKITFIDYFSVLQILLAKNFYDHFGLSNSNFNEYDTDLMLEYEDNETYKEFKDFFLDVLPEFEKFGRVIQFVVSYYLFILLL